jgi:hypothetical protein
MKLEKTTTTISQQNIFGGTDEIQISNKPTGIVERKAVPKLNRDAETSGKKNAGRSVQQNSAKDNLIEQVEDILGFRAIRRNGSWCRDKENTSLLMYSFNEKCNFDGPNPLGSKGSMCRDLLIQTYISSARSKFSPLFLQGEEEPIVRDAVTIFAMRMRSALPTEDPSLMLHAITGILGQHDFIDNNRSGETIRRNMKREKMRTSRANKRVAEAKAKGEVLTFEEAYSQARGQAKKLTIEPITEESIQEVDEFEAQVLSDDVASRFAAKNICAEVEILESIDFDDDIDELPVEIH